MSATAHPLAGTPGDPARWIDIDDDQAYAMSGLEAAHQQAAADQAEANTYVNQAVLLNGPVAPCRHPIIERDDDKDWWRCSICGTTESCHDEGLGLECAGGLHDSIDGNRRCSAHEALR